MLTWEIIKFYFKSFKIKLIDLCSLISFTQELKY